MNVPRFLWKHIVDSVQMLMQYADGRDRRQTPDATVEVLESEIIDLTCENSFVDLTNDDSGPVVIVDESYVLSSDEERESVARSTAGTISCPICLDSYEKIVESGRIVVSSQCGHLFCQTCISESLAISQTCPTCRMKLNHKKCHPIYI